MEQNPRTIEELKNWYYEKNLPPEKITRFFIGKNYNGAKAFGVYKDEQTGNYVVYKNKSTGERAIRYDGPNEEYAVNELYKKLKEEIYNQKMNNPNNFKNYSGNSNYLYNRQTYSGKRIELISPRAMTYLFFILFFMIVISIYAFSKKTGYYNYNNRYYYYQTGTWYEYDNRWKESVPPENLRKNSSDYFQSYNYRKAYEIDDFRYSGYYKEPENDRSSGSSWSSSSSDYDWDSGSSWDSDYTDWDSDW